MTIHIDALKKKFREGQHTAAIAECVALCVQHPDNFEIKKLCAMMHALTRNHARALELLLQLRRPGDDNADVLFNIGVCEAELKNFTSANQYFEIYVARFVNQPDGWARLAECKFELGAFEAGVKAADMAMALDASNPLAWVARGNCQKALGHFQEAIASFTQAIQLVPDAPKLRLARGDIFHDAGSFEQAITDYKAALKLAPSDGAVLNKAVLCLVNAGRGDEASRLCQEILQLQPHNMTAKLAADWLLGLQVPLWHIPMMNEQERNQAFHDGLGVLVTPAKTVFEIGTGSGLLAMMAARHGAAKVFTCETVPLIAATATKIVGLNHYADRITVLSKASQAVQLGKDMPEKADILVHEVFSSELLGEHVLPAIEDAKARLLKPGGEVLPAAASIMIALVGGDDIGSSVHVEEAFGFKLQAFNAISPRKRGLFREDLSPVLMSADTEALRFDFVRDSAFPAEEKLLELTVTKDGLCWGLIQWIRLEVAKDVSYENHPSTRRAVSNWQPMIFSFEAPLACHAGMVVHIKAAHDRSRPWFELVRQGP